MVFELPKDVRGYFEGVATGEYGEYRDSSEVKVVRSHAQGCAEEPDPFRLSDKNGQPVFCFRCGESSSAAKRIMSCDYCSHHWHMDCLDPPLTALPPLTKKWMCPLHTSHGYRKIRRPRHKLNTTDASLPRAFGMVAEIEIENDASSEEEKESQRPLEDGFESDFSIDGTTYRLPEKGIKLDFLEKIHMYADLFIPNDREKLRPKSLDMLSEQAAIHHVAGAHVINISVRYNGRSFEYGWRMFSDRPNHGVGSKRSH